MVHEALTLNVSLWKISKDQAHDRHLPTKPGTTRLRKPSPKTPKSRKLFRKPQNMTGYDLRNPAEY